MLQKFNNSKNLPATFTFANQLITNIQSNINDIYKIYLIKAPLNINIYNYF